jgi:dihydroorotase
VFEEENALDKFEGFASLHGPAFYRLPVNEDTITLHKSPFTVPDSIDCAGTPVVPFHAGETLSWSLSSV